MKNSKKILVVCGSGVATSTVIREKVKEGLQERGINVTMEQCKISEAKGQIEDIRPDIIVVNGPVQKDYGIPAVSGVSFLTGRGVEKSLDEIEELITE